jgi:hypothetical protein
LDVAHFLIDSWWVCIQKAPDPQEEEGGEGEQ